MLLQIRSNFAIFRRVASSRITNSRSLCQLVTVIVAVGCFLNHMTRSLAVEIRSVEVNVDRYLSPTQRFFITTGLVVDSVIPIQSVSLFSTTYAGSFPLSQRFDGSWFGAAPGQIVNLSATFDAIVTDANGTVVTIPGIAAVTPSIPLPLAAGLEMARIPFGWDIDMDDTNSQFYHAFVYDRVANGPSVWSTGLHPSPTLLENLPDAVLVPNRAHTLVPAAYVRFVSGPYDNGYSSIRHIGEHIDFISVPEPSSPFLVGLGVVIVLRRRRCHERKP